MSIQKMRLKRGWSQQQLAYASGLSTRTIQRIENGHTASVESLKSIAAVFEVDFSTLITETGMKDDTDSNNRNDIATTPQEARERIAFHRVQRLRGFYLHLLTYIVVNVGCLTINLLTTPERLWFVGLFLFWGLGLLVHALTVFIFDKYFGGQWERTQVEKQLGRPL